jgi:hypothetical protein
MAGIPGTPPGLGPKPSLIRGEVGVLAPGNWATAAAGTAQTAIAADSAHKVFFIARASF